MNHALYIAFSGLQSRAQAVDVAANNMANMSVPGFKKDRVYYNTFNRVAEHSRNELEISLADSRVAEKTVIDFSVGELVATGNSLDLALSEEGFFVVDTPQGERYTRNGAFRLNPERELITGAGFSLMGEGGELVIPQGDIRISQEGLISVEGVEVGRLQIVHFEDLSQLSKEGSSLFKASREAQQRPPVLLTVHQGYLEHANLNPIEGVASMVSLMRSFESLSLAIRSLIERVNQKVTDEVGRV